MINRTEWPHAELILPSVASNCLHQMKYRRCNRKFSSNNSTRKATLHCPKIDRQKKEDLQNLSFIEQGPYTFVQLLVKTMAYKMTGFI